MMTYEEALEYLNAPKYSATRPGLAPVTELMHRLGDVQKGLKYVHIAGTNGKGSTAAFMESALRAAGYRTGLYTSPFIERFTERIRVCGEEISEEDLARLTERVCAACTAMREDGLTEPTVFEMITAVGFLYFAEQKCDIVVLEVGMGGRLDATNIIPASEISVITPIAFDHMEFLGDTLAQIAYEKGGIIKPGGTLVTCPQEPEAAVVLQQICADQEAKAYIADIGCEKVLHADIHGQTFYLNGRQITISKLGAYQIRNAALAFTALDVLREEGDWPHLTDEAILRGLREASWPGRLELMHEDPVFLIDGAHNPHGVRALTEALRELFPGQRFLFVMGVLADKDYRTMLDLAEDLAYRFVTVTPDSPRAMQAEELARILQADGFPAEAAGSLEAAADRALELAEKRPRPIAAFGSLYYIGALRTVLRRKFGAD